MKTIGVLKIKFTILYIIINIVTKAVIIYNDSKARINSVPTIGKRAFYPHTKATNELNIFTNNFLYLAIHIFHLTNKIFDTT
jgi:hypothetical protein